MNQMVTLEGAQLPAHIQGDSTDASGLVTSESVPRITLRDAAFIIKKDGKELSAGLAKPIDVVILGIDPPEAKRTAKQYYDGAWTEDSADAPDCFSNNGVAPDPSVANPQSTTCAQCPKNAWGSGHDAEGNPSKGKACSDRKNLLVVLGGKHIDGDVFRLSVPPTSLKSLSHYGRELLKYNVNMHKIVTKISVDETNSKGMTFGYAGFLDETEANRMAARAAGAEIHEMLHPALPAPSVDAGPSMAEPKLAETNELDLNALGDAPPATQEAAPPPSKSEASDDGLDSDGQPWDERIHGAAKNKNADGTWRLKRGVSKELIAQVRAEHAAPQTASQDEGGNTESQTNSADDLDALLDNWGSNV